MILSNIYPAGVLTQVFAAHAHPAIFSDSIDEVFVHFSFVLFMFVTKISTFIYTNNFFFKKNK